MQDRVAKIRKTTDVAWLERVLAWRPGQTQTTVRMMAETGCDGVMVGRASLGNPWIFRDIKHFLEKGELLPEPTVNEKVDLALFHLDKSLQFKEG